MLLSGGLLEEGGVVGRSGGETWSEKVVLVLEINVCWTGKCRSVQPVDVAGLHCPKDENSG